MPCCAVTQKTTNKNAKFEIVKAFPPLSHEHVEGSLSKCTVLTVDLLQDHQILCSQACMCTLFSRELLQAGAVKGLIIMFYIVIITIITCN